MKKIFWAVLFFVCCSLAGYFLFWRPTVAITLRLEQLQNEEYAKGCKDTTSDKIVGSVAKRSSSREKQRNGEGMAEKGREEVPEGDGIRCPDVASRANLIAIDGLRFSSFGAIVAYVLGFASLAGLWIAFRESAAGDRDGLPVQSRGQIGMYLSTTGPDDIALTIVNVGTAAMWIHSVNVNDGLNLIVSGNGGIRCLPTGANVVIGARARHPMGYDRSSIEISFAQLTGDRCTFHADIIYRGGNWQIDDVRY